MRPTRSERTAWPFLVREVSEAVVGLSKALGEFSHTLCDAYNLIFLKQRLWILELDDEVWWAPPARPSLLQLPAPALQILGLVRMGMTRPIMRNWARLENVCAGFDSEISTFERFSQPHPTHTSLSFTFSPGSTSACQFRYMDLEREAVTNTELRGEYQLVASQIWRSAISVTGRHILICLRRWSDITTLSLSSKKPHSNKSVISQPNTGGDYARMRSTVGTAHTHILPVAPSPDPSIIIHCRTDNGP
ncbi:hypothetical protein EV421DRAFT_742082 [Armillaria borealis]|uniref:Uncharacterized protein n=1 Tax=Armillaria borealis TaxID=47425 RepID=A0AA39MP98_9AGAR|nr:hypothetical protein EV421DRAFT_742082 [Armillaria borealis]